MSAIVSGIGWHLVGAASAASFYAPISKVRKWSWETTWAFAGLFSWILAPWLVTSMLIPDFAAFYRVLDSKAFWGMFLFGAMWGVGNINYGLTMRYLGMSLGIGIAIGVTLVVGTLMPPILRGEFGHLITTSSGQITILGVFVALIGIGIVTWAGHLKEIVLGTATQEFNLKKGLFLAVMCGIFSSGFAFGLEAAEPIKQASLNLGIDPLYAMLPSYGIIMGGGAMVNLAYCFARLATRPELSLYNDLSQPARSLLINGLLAATGGIMWYLQFFFYAWGEASIPEHLSFVNWMLHMSGYVLCGGIVGLLLAEWKGVGSRPVRILCLGMLVIVGAANMVGMGMA
ncbi:L-rhamnose/proton symporter RhaT [Dickeya dianthicola]|uniref:L-rhamnose/proton symporter RhaT n=1 Tax=Dickeya dianthicola TaxID=204039 RepID=A0ABX9NUD4_9GAMM|nr:L-rhamnose/proton symporter RhaT [Dickeya dianthicola]MCI4068935.1 L-rhamnose/proton symporter RhaT [Dickeya dianthicola]MCI4113322.1 L-rhamnose/proton symporter RhaT [Dickeya dianthicola]MCI4119994.1 L-rhamnose/proton symporter RhaT [Dickeya dianthicola]MCI4123292.1 L-rhamnose/proton symporter RhaT [Dickeya dianthicola]MCI4188924.1 L-rhamnose/proton symporter RhaT [Dickeya dianthicola]